RPPSDPAPALPWVLVRSVHPRALHSFPTRRSSDLNLWKDAAHPRGLWRRTTLAEFRKAEPQWEELLDLDRLAADEGEDWALNWVDRKSTRLNSSHVKISYAVFCLKKKSRVEARTTG